MLNSVKSFIRRKESVLAQVSRVRTKLELAKKIRKKRLENQNEYEQLNQMKPLIVFKSNF